MAYHYVIKRPMIALTSVNCQEISYFHTLSRKGTFPTLLLNTKCMIWFSLLPLTETFIFRQIDPDITKNAHTSSCKVPVIIVRYSLKLNFLNRILTNSQVLIIKKSVP